MSELLLAAMLAGVTLPLACADNNTTAALQSPAAASFAGGTEGVSNPLMAGLSLSQACPTPCALVHAACMPACLGWPRPLMPMLQRLHALHGVLIMMCACAFTQGEPLPSNDGKVFLIVQADGNLVLYNSMAYSMFGPAPASAIWASGTYGNAGPTPFSLAMQTVRAVTMLQLTCCCLPAASACGPCPNS